MKVPTELTAARYALSAELFRAIAPVFLGLLCPLHTAFVARLPLAAGADKIKFLYSSASNRNFFTPENSTPSPLSLGSEMLFYFQFLAKTMAAAGEQLSEAMVVHSLVQADTVDSAAEQVTNSMGSVYLKIGDVRRAFVVRTTEELGQDRRLLSLSKQAERSRFAFLFEFSNGTETLCGPSLSQFISTRLPYASTSGSEGTVMPTAALP